MVGCLFTLIKGIIKGIGYLLYFTLPIIFCVVGFFVGEAVANAAFGKRYYGWEAEQKEKHSHLITIHWDETGSRTTEITVRDDINWTISGSKNDYGLYYTYFTGHANLTTQKDNSAVIMPQESIRAGYKFMGLYTSPFGGTQFVNAAGYSIRTVTMDLDLYALWEEV